MILPADESGSNSATDPKSYQNQLKHTTNDKQAALKILHGLRIGLR